MTSVQVCRESDVTVKFKVKFSGTCLSSEPVKALQAYHCFNKCSKIFYNLLTLLYIIRLNPVLDSFEY